MNWHPNSLWIIASGKNWISKTEDELHKKNIYHDKSSNSSQRFGDNQWELNKLLWISISGTKKWNFCLTICFSFNTKKHDKYYEMFFFSKMKSVTDLPLSFCREIYQNLRNNTFTHYLECYQVHRILCMAKYPRKVWNGKLVLWRILKYLLK